MNKRIKALALAGSVLATVVLTGCAREVDIDAANAEQVNGVNALYRFCDGPVLIYIIKRSGEDEFDWYWPGGCVQDNAGNWVFNTNPFGEPPPGDSDEDR